MQEASPSDPAPTAAKADAEWSRRWTWALTLLRRALAIAAIALLVDVLLSQIPTPVELAGLYRFMDGHFDLDAREDLLGRAPIGLVPTTVAITHQANGSVGS